MVTHILLWTYRPEVEEIERVALEGMLRELPALIPPLRELEFGVVSSWRVHEYSRACIMRFADQAGLDAYIAHPAHKAFISRFHSTALAMEAIDFAFA